MDKAAQPVPRRLTYGFKAIYTRKNETAEMESLVTCSLQMLLEMSNQ